MEDYIYLLALIAWAVFAFYRKTRKRSESAGEMTGTPSRQGRTTGLPTLEEILLGEEPVIPEPATASAPAWTEGMSPVLEETAFEKEYKRRGISSIEELDKPINMAPHNISEIQKHEIGSEDEGIGERSSAIDLRKAVIYSEILNRPYV
jgi:hypothetical protein